MTTQRIVCSGKSHPNASKSRAKETCSQYIDVELDSLAPGFRFLCRNCSSIAPPPPNTFAGKQFDRSLGRGGNPDPERTK